jgi:tRNA modification GTPase
LAGKPNVGKSSLLNLIAREERALVTEIPGTTRDTLDIDVAIKGYPVRFIDTAGLRRARGKIEQHGVARAERVLAECDIVCWIVDRSKRPARGQIDRIAALAADYAMIIVLNKSDLAAAWSPAQCTRLRECAPLVTLSALTGAGLGALEEALHARITAGCHHAEDDVLIVRMRQKELLQRAAAALARGRAQLVGEALPELLAADVADALEAFGELTGQVTSEDILDRIFAEFCIGK